MNDFLETLRARATAGFQRTIIFTEAGDERILEAASILLREKIVRPLLVCNVDQVEKVKALNLDYVLIDDGKAEELQKILIEVRASKKGTKDELTEDRARELSRDPLAYGMYLLRLNEGHGLVSGAVYATAEVLRMGLWIVGKAEGIKTISSSFYITVPTFRGSEDEVLTFSDCAVVPTPTSEQLADIAIAASDARTFVVGDVPRVAMLSYSTKGSGGESESILKVKEAVEMVRTRRPELIIDGEVQADVALVEATAERKSPGGIIKGNANVLIFPSLDSANIAYKLVATLQPKAQALGPILQGMNKPVSDLSRGAKVDDIVRVATIVATQANP